MVHHSAMDGGIRLGALPPGLSVQADLAKTHAAGRRHFVGYTDAEVDDLLRGFPDRVLGPPALSVVEGALITPLVRVAEGQFTGGVSDRAGYRTDLALHRGHADQRRRLVGPLADDSPAAPDAHLDRAWFGGYLFDHFGHFLLEGLARVLHPEVAASQDPVVFLSPTPEVGLRSFMTTAFSRAGVDPERVVLCGAPMQVDELRVQEPTFEIRGLVRPHLYRRLQQAEAAAPSTGLRYLSRSRLQYVRMVQGEPALEARLAGELGATIAHPQELSLDDQIDGLAAARLVVGSEGSAFHTLMFVGRPSHAVVLCSGVPHASYLLCDELFDGDTVYVNAARSGSGGDRKADWEIDADRVVAVLRAIELT